MFFIFGWGHQAKSEIGQVFKHACSHCNNDVYWTLWKYTYWFTIFFIPIFPYESKKLLLCPVCSYGIELSDTKYNELCQIIEANKLLSAEKITRLEYLNRIKQISSGTAVN